MNKLVSILMIALMMSAMSAADAKPSKKNLAIIRVGDTFKLIYANESRSKVKVDISDVNGDRVFSEELLSMHGFIRPYNFSNLPKGNYMICVTDLTGEEHKQICYSDKDLTADNSSVVAQPEKAWSVHMSSVSTNPDKVLVVMPKQGDSHFTIHIYDNGDQLMYSESHKTSEEFAKVFHLKQFEHGASVHLINNQTGQTKIFQVD